MLPRPGTWASSWYCAARKSPMSVSTGSGNVLVALVSSVQQALSRRFFRSPVKPMCRYMSVRLLHELCRWGGDIILSLSY